MCGIAGYIGGNQKNIEMMFKSIMHRGPDNISSVHIKTGKYHIALGHTRLSIIDLSSSANQPFVSEDLLVEQLQLMDKSKIQLMYAEFLNQKGVFYKEIFNIISVELWLRNNKKYINGLVN